MAYYQWPSFGQGQYAPITYLRGIPVYLTTILAAGHVVTMLIIALLMGAGKSGWLNYLVLETDVFSTQEFWTLLTYSFYHDITERHIWFVISIAMFVIFGLEVERFVGRSAFTRLYGLLVFVPPLIVIGLAQFFASSVGTVPLAGLHEINLAIFVGFALIYPNAPIFNIIPAKWLAAIFVAINVVFNFADGKPIYISWTLSSVGVAYLYLKSVGVGGGFQLMNWYEGWKLQQAEERFQQRKLEYEQREEKREKSVDEILEKISNQGIQSLSEEEKKVLGQASDRLVKRDQFKE